MQKDEEVVPTYATTQGTLDDATDAGGTWANLSTASAAIHRHPADPANPVPEGYNLFSQFSATCFYFASGLVDLGETVPIGLIQSAIGGCVRPSTPPADAGVVGRSR